MHETLRTQLCVLWACIVRFSWESLIHVFLIFIRVIMFRCGRTQPQDHTNCNIQVVDEHSHDQNLSSSSVEKCVHFAFSTCMSSARPLISRTRNGPSLSTTGQGGSDCSSAPTFLVNQIGCHFSISARQHVVRRRRHGLAIPAVWTET